MCRAPHDTLQGLKQKSMLLTKSMRVESSSDSTPQHLLLLSDKDPQLQQPLDEDPMSQKMNGVPVDSGSTESFGLLQTANTEEGGEKVVSSTRLPVRKLVDWRHRGERKKLLTFCIFNTRS